jgi:glucose-1-phosphatase
VTHLFFDFGNVIGFFDHRKAVRRLGPYTHLSPEEFFRAVYHGDLEDRYERGRVTTREFFDACQRDGGLRCDFDTFVDGFSDIFEPNPAVTGLIPRLKQAGNALVLASNTNDAHFTRYRAMFAETLAHFDALAVSHEAGVRKPEPAFFDYALSLAGANADDSVFIDDMPENVTAAIDCGFRTVLYHPGIDLIAELARVGIRV